MTDDQLAPRWREFVDAVEQGYRFGLFDYRNDLDIRERIAELGLDETVAGADARFRSLLTATGKQIWESDREDAFWIWGYPSNASGELLEDLQAEGLTDES